MTSYHSCSLFIAVALCALLDISLRTQRTLLRVAGCCAQRLSTIHLTIHLFAVLHTVRTSEPTPGQHLNSDRVLTPRAGAQRWLYPSALIPRLLENGPPNTVIEWPSSQCGAAMGLAPHQVHRRRATTDHATTDRATTSHVSHWPRQPLAVQTDGAQCPC